MRQPDRLRALDHRRRGARLRAPVLLLASAIGAALTAVVLGFVALAGLARADSLLTDRSIAEARVWGWSRGVVVVAVVLVVTFVAATVIAVGLFGTSSRVQHQLGARRIPDGDRDHGARTVVNVVEALALGLGVDPPDVAIVEDPAPNALSIRRWNRGTIIVTRGLLQLPRAEIEAVCAHELAHLNAVDARWIGGALAGAERWTVVNRWVVTIGVAAVAFGAWAGPLPTPIIGGVTLIVAATLLQRLAERTATAIRRETDEVADVAAILLARNPAAMGHVCRRLHDDRSAVRVTSPLVRNAWFELVPEAAQPRAAVTTSIGVAVDELQHRTAAAYAAANLELPAPMR